MEGRGGEGGKENVTEAVSERHGSQFLNSVIRGAEQTVTQSVKRKVYTTRGIKSSLGEKPKPETTNRTELCVSF